MDCWSIVHLLKEELMRNQDHAGRNPEFLLLSMSAYIRHVKLASHGPHAAQTRIVLQSNCEPARQMWSSVSAGSEAVPVTSAAGASTNPGL